ncbi:Phage Mu protein F like protein [Companilactobacillus nantensis DSM 16982]|uniref:Phage Mu protein F like protein n=2 Tax=Companilactobacillus nantensis TaxID=305793 RepID=A0A0R1WQ87_9LACO|nr:Phage Mu protein F like protein [Companilactobacillus nantensis DSM 16982]
MYRDTQSKVINDVDAFMGANKSWTAKASPDEIANFLSNLKDTFYNASPDDQNLIKIAYGGNSLKTNGDMLMANITRDVVRQSIAQKIHLGVSTENIPDVVTAPTYKYATKVLRNNRYISEQSKNVDAIIYKSVQNTTLDNHVDSDMFSSINKQTMQTLRKIRDVAETAAKSPKDSLNWKNEISNILTGGDKATDGQMGRAAGLIRTATAQAMNRTRLQDFQSRGVSKYKYISLEAVNTCADCDDLDGKIFNVEDAEEGVNFPLMHPNCQCTVIEMNNDDDWDTSDYDVTDELDKL